MPRFYALALMIAAFSTGAVAVEPPPGLIPLPEQPDIPPPVQSGQPMEPDVTIIRRGRETIEEYRVNNRLYMVKIKPSIGPAYYLTDTDGDGSMDTRSEIVKGDTSMNIPRWVLLRW